MSSIQAPLPLESEKPSACRRKQQSCVLHGNPSDEAIPLPSFVTFFFSNQLLLIWLSLKLVGLQQQQQQYRLLLESLRANTSIKELRIIRLQHDEGRPCGFSNMLRHTKKDFITLCFTNCRLLAFRRSPWYPTDTEWHTCKKSDFVIVTLGYFCCPMHMAVAMIFWEAGVMVLYLLNWKQRQLEDDRSVGFLFKISAFETCFIQYHEWHVNSLSQK